MAHGHKTDPDADLRGANLWAADLRGADLAGANLAGANLAGANLAGANLAGADLRGANLITADLRLATLTGAKLITADLRLANLTGANLEGADLRLATLTGANLEGARRVQKASDLVVRLALLGACSEAIVWAWDLRQGCSLRTAWEAARDDWQRWLGGSYAAALEKLMSVEVEPSPRSTK